MISESVERKFIYAAQSVARRNVDNIAKLTQSITILYHTGLKQHNINANIRTKLENSVQLSDAIMIGVFSIIAGASDPILGDLAGSEWRSALGLPPAPIVCPGQP